MLGCAASCRPASGRGSTSSSASSGPRPRPRSVHRARSGAAKARQGRSGAERRRSQAAGRRGGLGPARLERRSGGAHPDPAARGRSRRGLRRALRAAVPHRRCRRSDRVLSRPAALSRPERLEAQAAEGTRTNMRAVFEAVAHRSPYPNEQFAENRWNHMVLKALFVGSALHPIQGLDARANPSLARMLCDYAHERWAAGRPVSPSCGAASGRTPTPRRWRDLQRVLATGDASERKAAALALAACPTRRRTSCSLRRPTSPRRLSAASCPGRGWSRALV